MGQAALLESTRRYLAALTHNTLVNSLVTHHNPHSNNRVIPMILYQYRGNIKHKDAIGYFIDLITNGSMKFSEPSSFNDPFDCCPTQVSEIPPGALPHAVIDEINHCIQKATSKVVGVSCLTPHPDKMLMWSHYGNQHASICVGFDTDILLEKCPKNSKGNPAYNHIRKVTYTDIRPSEKDTDAIYKKSKEWAYEDEYRIVSLASKGTPQWGAGVWSVPPDSIKEVVFGARIPKALQNYLIKVIKTNRPDISLKKAVLHSHEYKIVIEDLDGQPQVAPMTGELLGPNGNWINI